MTKSVPMVVAVLSGILLGGFLGSTPAIAAETRIVAESNPPGPVRHGIDDIREALNNKNVQGGVIEIVPLSEASSSDWEKPGEPARTATCDGRTGARQP